MQPVWCGLLPAFPMVSLVAFVAAYELSKGVRYPMPPTGALVAHYMQQEEEKKETSSSSVARSSVASSQASSGTSSAVPASRVDNKIGVYLTSSSVVREEFADATLDALKEAGGNSIVFDVKGSMVYFHTDASLVQEIGLVSKYAYDLPAFVRKAKERGFYTIGRFIALKDPVFAQRKPESQIRHIATGRSIGNVWVDGSVPLVQDYNRQILEDLLRADIDEINLDYIRFPTEYGVKAAGLNGNQKADKVGAFLKMARETIDRVNPRTKLGISTYAILGWNFPVNVESLGQDFVRFAPLVDIISPMAYPDSFAQGYYYRPGKDPRSRPYFLVWRTLDGYKTLLGPEHSKKLRPWLQAYNLSNQGVRDEMEAVYDAGLCGFQMWSAGNKYGVTYAALKMKMEVPERCL